MQLIDFYKLSRAVQERFIGSVSGTGLPAPILRSNRPPRAPLAWLGAAVTGALALPVLFRAGFGSLSSGMVIQSLPWAGAYVAAASLAVFGVLRALSILR